MKKLFFFSFFLFFSLFFSRVVHSRPVFDIQIFETIIQLISDGNLIQNRLSQLLLSRNETVISLRSINFTSGKRLIYRYTNLGVTILEALSWDGVVFLEERLKKRLKKHIVDLARWGHTSEVRSIGLIALSYMQDRADLKMFEEASTDSDIGIRYAVIEAMLNWNHVDLSLPILENMSVSDTSSLIRLIATGALVQYRPEFLDLARQSVLSQDWLVRSIAYKILSEHGTADDYNFIIEKIGRESLQQNKFALAEMLIASLNLFPLYLEKKKTTQDSQLQQIKTRIQRGSLTKSRFHYSGPLHLDPLMIVSAKFDPIDVGLLDPRINSYLLDMLQNSVNERFSIQDANSLSSLDLDKLSSVHGIHLRSRYSILGILISEGLQSIPSSFLRFELNNLVQDSYRGTIVQNFASISLAYSRDPSYFSLFQRLFEKEPFSNKFAAIESLRILNAEIGYQFVLDIASSSNDPILRVYAAYSAWYGGKRFGRDVLYLFLDHQDWIIRAMAIRYIGELGSIEDYQFLIGYLNNFDHPIVQAELCVTLLKLFFNS